MKLRWNLMATQMGDQSVERASALLSELARPTMEHLSEMSRETVNLAVPRVGMDLPARAQRWGRRG
jgi:DNA-binding IclR family transcriptional regulator